MNSEELKTEFGLEFPTEIDGYKRPAEPLESGHDWFLEIPQLIAKDKVLYTGMNLILSALLSNEKLLKQWHDTLQNVVNAQDWRVVTDNLKGYMTPELKKKLDGIATGANNYVHPSNHPATMITQDATHRFVSDTEKSTWNAKASTAVVSTTANGLAPKRDGNASHFLAGDGTWKVVPSASSAATATKATQDSRGQQIDTTYVKGVTGSNATLTVTKGNGTTSTVTVNNVANATKATQDSAGQQINTTYVKGVTGSNATLTVTKGNGSTSSVIVNNVANATSASRIGTNSGNNGNTAGGSLPYGLSWSTIYNNNFPFTYGNVISIKGQGATQIAIEWSGSDATAARIAIRNARDQSLGKWSAWSTLARITDNVASATKATNDSSNRNIVNTYAPKASPAFSGTPTSPTPATSDNSTKIATTAFVRNLINQFKTDGTLGGIVGGSLTQNGWVKYSNGLILQWGLTNNGKEGVSFPIVFKNVYALTMGNLNNTSWSPHFRDVTTTGFKATVEGTGYSYHGYWIAIGI